MTELSPSIVGTNPRYSETDHIMYATPDGVVFAVPFAVRSLKVTGTPVRVAEGVAVGGSGAAGFAVARGGVIALWQNAEGYNAGQQLVAVTRAGVATPLGAKFERYDTPRVSPDGRQIALTFYAGSYRLPDIWRFDLQSKVLTRVTTGSASTGPAWSADGERIAYIKQGDSVARWLSAVAKSRDPGLCGRPQSRTTPP